jgi:hypothetical protein
VLSGAAVGLGLALTAPGHHFDASLGQGGPGAARP